jgi:hypothetical protein
LFSHGGEWSPRKLRVELRALILAMVVLAVLLPLSSANSEGCF